MNMKIKKSHKWIEMIEARCPYCGYYHRHFAPPEKGVRLVCKNSRCSEEFEIGEQSSNCYLDNKDLENEE